MGQPGKTNNLLVSLCLLGGEWYFANHLPVNQSERAKSTTQLWYVLRTNIDGYENIGDAILVVLVYLKPRLHKRFSACDGDAIFSGNCRVACARWLLHERQSL